MLDKYIALNDKMEPRSHYKHYGIFQILFPYIAFVQLNSTIRNKLSGDLLK